MSESWPPAESSDPGNSFDPSRQPPSGRPHYLGPEPPPVHPNRPSWPGQLSQTRYAGPVHDNRSNWPAVTGFIFVILSGLWALQNFSTVLVNADLGYRVGYRMPVLVLACVAVGLCILGIGRARSTGKGQALAITGVVLGSLVIAFALLAVSLAFA